MAKRGVVVIVMALSGLAMSANAQANATRASDQKLGPACGTNGQAPCAAGQGGPLKGEVGPPGGFPGSPGLDVARMVASGNAAFKRDDSPGG